MVYKVNKQFQTMLPANLRGLPIGTVMEYKGQEYTFSGISIYWNHGKKKIKECRVLLRSSDKGGKLEVAPSDKVTIVEKWVPKMGETVAKWNTNWANDVPVVFGPYGDGWCYGMPHDNRCARIPNNFNLATGDITVGWWRRNAEKYEVDDE